MNDHALKQLTLGAIRTENREEHNDLVTLVTECSKGEMKVL